MIIFFFSFYIHDALKSYYIQLMNQIYDINDLIDI